jgi:nucleoside-diphosphate-sugar epimerase
MKIVVTGSLGNISKPLTKELVQKKHSVTVISSVGAQGKVKLKDFVKDFVTVYNQK